MIFAEGESLLLLEAGSQVCPFLAARYLTDHDESLAAPPEEMESIGLLAGHLEDRADWEIGIWLI